MPCTHIRGVTAWAIWAALAQCRGSLRGKARHLKVCKQYLQVCASKRGAEVHRDFSELPAA